MEGYFAESQRQLNKKDRDTAPKLPAIGTSTSSTHKFNNGGATGGTMSASGEYTTIGGATNPATGAGDSFALSDQPVAKLSKDMIMRNLLEEKYEDLLKE